VKTEISLDTGKESIMTSL